MVVSVLLIATIPCLRAKGPAIALRHHVEVEVEGVDLHVGQAGVGGERLRDLHLAGDAELDDGLLGR